MILLFFSRFFYNKKIIVSVIDASGKPPSGILQGNWNDLGDYHQCLRINTVADNMQFQGKYCTIRIPLEQNPIEVDNLPTLPPDWTWPSTLPTFPSFGSTTPSEGITEQYDFTTLPDGVWNQMVDYQQLVKAQKDQQKFSNLQQYVFGITGMGQPVESR